MPSRPRPVVERLLRGFAIAAVVASVLLTLAFSFGLVAGRPILSGEAEVLHEAARIHDGYALYTDPIAGAFDYGPVPTRCYVAYPPLWSWVLSNVPPSASETVGRVLCSLIWFGVLAWLAMQARPAQRGGAWLAAGVRVAPLSQPLAGYVFPYWRPLLAANLPPYVAMGIENVLVAPLATAGYLDDHAAEYDTYVARFESRHFHFHVYAIRRAFAGHDAALRALEDAENAGSIPSYLDLR